MVDRMSGLEQLFGPSDRVKILHHSAKPRGVGRDWCGHFEVVVVGGPAEGGAQIGELGGEPGVGLALAGAVPPRPDVRYSLCEVAGMRGPGSFCVVPRDELLL